MSRARWLAILAIIFLGCLAIGALPAQEANQPSLQKSASGETATGKKAGDANKGVAQILAKTTDQSAHSAETWGRKLGLGPAVSFAISLALNFAGIALFVYLLVRSKLPQAFRDRTAAIKKGIQEAQAASADATRRLTDIEVRLSRLDSEVEEIRRSAEQEAAAEEERILQAAQGDKQKVVEAAEAEIQAIARNARRELKGYAASLAVDLAARRIHVDEPTDHALVRDFVDRLGKDGE